MSGSHPQYARQDSEQSLQDALEEYYVLNPNLLDPDTWTIFGTTAGLSGYLQYFKYPQVNAIFAEVGPWRIASEFVRVLPDVVRVVRAAVRLRPKWPWAEYDRFLGSTLGEIRRGHNIRLVPVVCAYER